MDIMTNDKVYLHNLPQGSHKHMHSHISLSPSQTSNATKTVRKNTNNGCICECPVTLLLPLQYQRRYRNNDRYSVISCQWQRFCFYVAHTVAYHLQLAVVCSKRREDILRTMQHSCGHVPQVTKYSNATGTSAGITIMKQCNQAVSASHSW